MEKEFYREPLVLREYGRNVQMLIKHITTLPTKEERTHAAYALIELMKQLNPSVREHNDNMQRIWDHLHHMADFKLDIDAPFPPPTPETIFQKPKNLSYHIASVKFKHYGKNVELLVKKASLITDEEERGQVVWQIVKLMKGFYSAWNNDNIEEDVLLEDIKQMSEGVLDYTMEDLKEYELPREQRKHKKHYNNQHHNSNRPHTQHNRNTGQQGSNQQNNNTNNNFKRNNNTPNNNQNRNNNNSGENRNPNYNPNYKGKKK
jgi:hypothetical protein